MEGSIVIIVLILFTIFAGVKIVQARTAYAVLTLGKPSRVIREGLNIIIPYIQTTKKQTLAMTNLDVGVDSITKDNVKTRIDLNVIFRVQDNDKAIIDSLFIINDPIKAIRAMVEEQLRAKVYEFQHDEIFSKRNEIGDEVKNVLASKLQEFGMELDSVQVKDIQLDPRVLDAMNSVVASAKNKLASINDAEGRKQSDILNAEADKQVKKLIGEGMALQREAIANGFRNSIAEIKSSDDSLKGGEILEFLLASSRIETLEKIGHDNAKVIYINENLEGKMASLIGNQG
jgi:regulator of protease activity HflC (stomatin/prohibitin superfamily)